MTEAVIKTIKSNSKMGNEVKVQETPTGQFIMTVPRSIADAWGITKGDVIEFVFDNGKIVLVNDL